MNARHRKETVSIQECLIYHENNKNQCNHFYFNYKKYEVIAYGEMDNPEKHKDLRKKDKYNTTEVGIQIF